MAEVMCDGLHGEGPCDKKPCWLDDGPWFDIARFMAKATDEIEGADDVE